jgi:predicted kinase
MSDIVFLVGLPGTGKSTWVRENYPDATIISSDNIIEKIAEETNSTYNAVFRTHMKEADKQTFSEFAQAVNDDVETIVVDRTNMSTNSRNRFLSKIDINEHHLMAVVFCAPEKSEWDRRLDGRLGKTIPWEVIERMADSFEMPSKEEGFDVVQIVRS